jgi:hypothetical protein
MLQVQKSDSGLPLKHASVTPGSMEYTKYNPPGVQLSRDALATKILFVTYFLSVIF